jgi:hypothetical protein
VRGRLGVQLESKAIVLPSGIHGQRVDSTPLTIKPFSST